MARSIGVSRDRKVAELTCLSCYIDSSLLLPYKRHGYVDAEMLVALLDFVRIVWIPLTKGQ